ncbi:MAG: photosystem II reaction center protein Ycf12 [Pseudanabaenales cyanobacterium]|nr:photosystem II reaction center protein Ycf12 [Pseudanabaenales cyanobacterium]
MNIEVVAQMTMLALILLAGPLIVGLVALRDGDM